MKPDNAIPMVFAKRSEITWPDVPYLWQIIFQTLDLGSEIVVSRSLLSPRGDLIRPLKGKALRGLIRFLRALYGSQGPYKAPEGLIRS